MMRIILVLSGYAELTAMGGTIAYFGKIGIWLPSVAAPVIGVLEFFGGIALLVGLFVRYLGVLYTIEFIVTTLVAKLPIVGYFETRIDLMMFAGAVALLFLGAGPWSIDSVWLGRGKRT